MHEPSIFTASRDPFRISTDPSLLDLDVIHGFLSTCYWSAGIARATVERAIANSMCFGLYDTSEPRSAHSASSHSPLPIASPSLVGFARVITDRASYAYLCDVFVLESARSNGLGIWLIESLLIHPDLQGLRRFTLLTRDAHGLYERFGFKPMSDPTRYMERWDPDVYKRRV